MYIMTMRMIVKEGGEMFRDATSLAQAVRDKQVSRLELVLETIEKAERLNPRLNAIVSTRYEQRSFKRIINLLREFLCF